MLNASYIRFHCPYLLGIRICPMYRLSRSNSIGSKGDLNALTLLYKALGLDNEPVTARFRILGTDDRLLTSYSRPLRMPYIARIPEIIEERTYNLNEWNAGVIDLSISIIKSICLKFNWEDPPTSVFKDDIQKLFSRRF